METTRLLCCGVRELASIARTEPAQTLKDLCEHRRSFDYYYNKPEGFNTDAFRTGSYIFTEAGVRSKYGKKLKQYIEDNALGTVTAAPPFKNRNTGRKITLFVWAFDYNAIRAWYERKGWEPKPAQAA